MFENQNINIKEIGSAVYVRPNKEEKHVRYGNDSAKLYQLVYKISGTAVIHFNGEIFKTVPGTVYIIPKCENPDYYVERPEVGECIDIFFDTDTAFLQNIYSLNFGENIKIKNLFQNIYKLWITKPQGYYCKCLSAVYEILYEMILRGNKYILNSKYKIIEPGIKYIHNNLYNEIDFYVPSQICGISYTYFKKLFIEKFGVPPVRYVNSLRLERSRELLLLNQYSVNEIAKMCGFENTYYFLKKFKEKYRFAPTVYKKITD